MLILTGCSSSVTPIEVKYSPVKQVQLNLPKVEELKLDPVDWHVINQNNQEEVFKNLEKKNYDPALMGLTDKGYENLSVNLTKILTVMEQQRLTIEAYDKYQKRQADTIEQFNDEQTEKQKQATAQGAKKDETGVLGRLKFW